MPVFRVSFGGPLYSDVWNCNLHLASSNNDGAIFDPTGTTQSKWMMDVVGDIQKWWAASGCASSAKLAYVKANQIDPITGQYTSKTRTNLYEFPTPIAGPASGNGMPQLSLCISLLTDIKRGPAARGRFYPPSLGAYGVDTNGQVNSSTRDSQAAAGAQLIRDLSNWPGIDINGSLEVVVLGKGGATQKVTSVAVGSVMDTQRRRRSKLRETYSTVKV